DDQVRPEFFDHHAGAEAVVDAANVETAISIELIDDQFDQIFVVVNDKDFALAAVQGVRGDTVVPHERVELVPRNAAKSAAWNSKAFQLARVETADNRLLTDLTNLGSFTGRKNCFHVCSTTLSLVDGMTILALKCPAGIH